MKTVRGALGLSICTTVDGLHRTCIIEVSNLYFEFEKNLKGKLLPLCMHA